MRARGIQFLAVFVCLFPVFAFLLHSAGLAARPEGNVVFYAGGVVLIDINGRPNVFAASLGFDELPIVADPPEVIGVQVKPKRKASPLVSCQLQARVLLARLEDFHDARRVSAKSPRRGSRAARAQRSDAPFAGQA